MLLYTVLRLQRLAVHQDLRGNALFHLMQLRIPPGETLRKLPDLVPREHPWLDPGDLRLLVHLVQRALDQLQAVNGRVSAARTPTNAYSQTCIPQRFHYQMLDLVQGQMRLLGDGLERHSSVIRASLEHGLDECHKTDLLSQERVVFLQDRLREHITISLSSRRYQATWSYAPPSGRGGRVPRICRCCPH